MAPSRGYAASPATRCSPVKPIWVVSFPASTDSFLDSAIPDDLEVHNIHIADVNLANILGRRKEIQRILYSSSDTRKEKGYYETCNGYTISLVAEVSPEKNQEHE